LPVQLDNLHIGAYHHGANQLTDRPSRVLLLFLIKDGRNAYTPEYPASANKK
jgi:hypothetical protein